jgi:hypothetical protein
MTRRKFAGMRSAIDGYLHVIGGAHSKPQNPLGFQTSCCSPVVLSCVVPTPPFSLDEKINTKLKDDISLICANAILQLKLGIFLVSTKVP